MTKQEYAKLCESDGELAALNKLLVGREGVIHKDESGVTSIVFSDCRVRFREGEGGAEVEFDLASEEQQ